MWLGTLPIGALAQRYGRRTAFQIGTLAACITGLIWCVAVLNGSFLLFNVGAFFCGFYAAAHQAYRFAAADTASDAFKPKAISWVLIGGIFAAVIGPQLVILTKDLWPPYLFAATYLVQAGFAVLAGCVLMLVNIPKPPARPGRRPWPAAVGNPAAAALHRGGGLRHCQLFDDEHGDDLGAARHGRMQPFGDRCDARAAMARARHVRAELHHRLADRALRQRSA